MQNLLFSTGKSWGLKSFLGFRFLVRRPNTKVWPKSTWKTSHMYLTKDKSVYSFNTFLYSSLTDSVFCRFKIFVHSNDSVHGDWWSYFPKDPGIFTEPLSSKTKFGIFRGGGEPGCLRDRSHWYIVAHLKTAELDYWQFVHQWHKWRRFINPLEILKQRQNLLSRPNV